MIKEQEKEEKREEEKLEGLKEESLEIAKKGTETKEQKEHILVKHYLQQHSLVESNIKSFNDFVERRMQQIVDEVNESLPKGDVEIKLGKIRLGKPSIVEADGSIHPILPAEARLRNLTYSAPLYLEIGIKYDSDLEQQEVEIGRIPVIVKSKYCNLAGMPKEQLIKNYEDPLDFGGYFIINGNERVMVMIEDLAPNQPFIEVPLRLRLLSQRGTYRIPTTISSTSDGILEISFGRFRNIPLVVLLKALGMLKEAEIADAMGEASKVSDLLLVNFYEFASIENKEQALSAIAEKASIVGTKKEVLDKVKQRIDSFLLPHVGITPEHRLEKAIMLCKLVKHFIIAKENPNFASITTDKDHYANKRVRLSGDLLADLFRVNLTILLRDIQHSLQRISKRKRVYSIKTLAKSTLFSHRIESAIATGSWIGERTGVTQNMDKTNCLAMLSQLQRISSLLPGEQENFRARTLHPTHYGRFCPIETPEGLEIGLRKNLAILAKISTAIPLEENEFIKKLVDKGLRKSIQKENGKAKEEKAERKEETGIEKAEERWDVFWNGKFIGEVENGIVFAQKLKELRRSGQLHPEISVRIDKNINAVVLSSDVGRVLRPLIIVENGKSKLTPQHLEAIATGRLKWENLVEQGIIEYLDASEEENALVALPSQELTPEHTHMEIDDIDLLGAVTSLVPYGNHDQSSRLNRGSKTQKQSLGLYAANYHCRLDTDVSILHYPQKPIVRSFVYDTLNIYPAGQNVVVAVLTYEGYNVEDAIVMNRGSIERGLGRSTYFRPYSSTELYYAGGLSDKICIPTKDTSGYRTEHAYRLLEDDGITYPEAVVNENDVVIGKVSPPKFLSETGEIAIKTQKESSVAIRQEEKGIVDDVFVSVDGDGNKIVHVRTRDERIPEIGDKFSTAHGQKGVIGMIVPEEDMPFSARGIKPDIIFNPHGIPSRMTVGYLLEMLAGKVGCLSGKIIDGTIFSGTPAEQLEAMLQNLGFRYDGKETLFNGITGQMLSCKIYIGNMYYLRLKYMVANKMHARASGKVTLLTRQPIEGRARGGALRLGEMEQQALVAHGASLLLKERYDSDKVIIYVCTKCGGIAIKDNIKNKIYCPVCQTSTIEPIEVSYAFKLLMEELMSLHVLPRFKLKNKYEQ